MIVRVGSHSSSLQEGTPMPTTQEPRLCACGCGDRTFNLFAPGHDQRYRGHCLDRISAGDATGADDMEHYIPGHAKHYDMVCLRNNVGQNRKLLPPLCRRG
jgi:hypothetical protein